MAIFAADKENELQEKMDNLLLELHRSQHVRITCIQDLDAIECALRLDQRDRNEKIQPDALRIDESSPPTQFFTLKTKANSLKNSFYSVSQSMVQFLKLSASNRNRERHVTRNGG